MFLFFFFFLVLWRNSIPTTMQIVFWTSKVYILWAYNFPLNEKGLEMELKISHDGRRKQKEKNVLCIVWSALSQLWRLWYIWKRRILAGSHKRTCNCYHNLQSDSDYILLHTNHFFRSYRTEKKENLTLFIPKIIFYLKTHQPRRVIRFFCVDLWEAHLQK